MLLIAKSLQLSKNRFWKVVEHLLIIVIFAVLYYIGSMFANEKGKEKTPRLSFFDAFYFSLVTQTTVGYGDIAPVNKISKTICMFQLLTIMGVLVIDLF